MADEDEEPQHIYEARDEKMVPINDGNAKWRIARFLLPLSNNVKQAIFIPHTTPLLSDILPHTFQPQNVTCKGWNSPQLKWKQWVLQLAPKYQTLWIQAGIHDAIFSSTYELRFNQEIVLGLTEFWCTQTNTFVFPWGEATITLEDVMILGGYPLLGELVNSPMTEDLERIVRKMEKFRDDMLKSKSKKAAHAAWLKQFMEEDNEIGHVAFLSLWLSRYVFPSRFKDTLESNVFPIAAKLSRGLKVALGPAILANVYGKLREFTLAALESLMEETVFVPGHFQLLQAWAFERFPALVMGPKSPNLIEPGEPRMARWNRVNFKLNMPLVRSALRLAENFEWRPYASDLVNWHHKSFYKESEQLVFDSFSLDEELQSYVRCLRVSELVGTDGKREKYFPNRVAMQFGMDQDLPGDVLNFNCTSEILSVFIPSKSFQPGVSMRYSNWWKDSMTTREGAIKDVLSQQNSLKDSRTSVQKKQKNEDIPEVYVELKNVDNPKKVSKKAVDGQRCIPITKSWLNVKKDVYEDSSGDDVPLSSKIFRNEVRKRSSNPITKPRVDFKKYVYEDSSGDDVPLSSKIFRNEVRKRSSNPITKPRVDFKKYVYEDSSGDDVPLSSKLIRKEVRKRSLSPITKPRIDYNKYEYEDSSGDDVPLTSKFSKGMWKRSHNLNKEVDSSSSCDHERVEKEKSLAANMDNSQEKVTFESVSPAANEVQAKMAGGSMNPITIDDDSDKSANDDYCSRSSKRGKDLEERIKTLEKMMGVSQG